MHKTIQLKNISIGNHLPLVLFGGVNVLESREVAHQVVESMLLETKRLKIPFIFKASFDKANRSSSLSYRGPGIKLGLEMLQEIKNRFGCPIITDVHEPDQAMEVAKVADVLQIPAFLCRQTDLVTAVAKTGVIINVKKAQFLAPQEMKHILKKIEESGNKRVLLCERGTQFGYNNLVVDMLGFSILKNLAVPVMFDVTHALQLPGKGAYAAEGRRSQVLQLAKAGVSQGISSLFLEVHPKPDQAKCDGPCALPLEHLGDFLKQIKELDDLIKGQSFLSIR